ncbi:hypothetical protein FRC17_002453, partial [Serendipita sp. 399]
MKFAEQVGGLKLRQNPRIYLSILVSLFLTAVFFSIPSSNRNSRLHRRPLHAEEFLSKCKTLHIKPGPPKDFASRTVSDRYVPGTNATLIRNATIWIGAREGTYDEGDVLLDKGLIVKVGHIPKAELPAKYNTINANG